MVLAGLKVYVAGSFIKWRQVREVQDLLRVRGAKITYDWTQAAEALDGKPEQEFAGDREQIALDELRGVREANVVVIRWPGRYGTHVEMGAALEAVKPVCILDEDEDLKIEKNAVVFYHHPRIRIFQDRAALLACLELHLCSFPK